MATGIKIKKSHKGRFTAWCKENGFNGVTGGCIAKAKAQAKKTGNGHLAKMANFAKTAHRKGGFSV